MAFPGGAEVHPGPNRDVGLIQEGYSSFKRPTEGLAVAASSN